MILTIPGLVIGLAASLVVLPLLSLFLRRLATTPVRALAIGVASVALAVGAALLLGATQGEPNAILAALLVAPGVQMFLCAWLMPRGPAGAGWRFGLLGTGALWIILAFARFGGLA
ncbi:hypothetical protein [Muricoccus radiodurans]|uniref:hypothetical protein n=1 Tax=Muricoccus radiodurans TaxID=2231721 RepID=UPI003CF03F80